MTTERKLERRYRRLLAWYPPAYRDSNGDEMLGVAMARSQAGQRWPRPGEAVSFIWSGAGKRLRMTGVRNGLRGQAWRDAATVLTIIGSLVLAAETVRNFGYPVFALPPSLTLARVAAQVAGWLLVAITASLGMRRVAAVAALASLAGAAAEMARHALATPYVVAASCWVPVLVATTASAAVIALGGERHTVISRRAVVAIAAVMTLPGAWPAVQAALTTYTATSDGGTIAGVPLSGLSNAVDFGLQAIAGIGALIVIVRLRPAVRRRVVVAMLPFATVSALSWGTFNGLTDSFMGFYPQAPLGLSQLIGLTTVSVGTLALGLMWLVRYERTLRRVAEEGVTT